MPIASTRITGFRTWLRKTPQPAKIRCGDTVIRIGVSATKWKDAEDSVAALDPATVEALGVDGDVLRVMALREETPSEAVPDREIQKEAWPESKEAQMAMIITAACDRAAGRHENAYKMAFDALKGMYDAQSQRLEAAQMRVAQLEAALIKVKTPQIVQEYNDESEESDSLVKTLLTTAMQNPQLVAAMAAQVSGNSATNGKGS